MHQRVLLGTSVTLCLLGPTLGLTSNAGESSVLSNKKNCSPVLRMTKEAKELLQYCKNLVAAPPTTGISAVHPMNGTCNPMKITGLTRAKSFLNNSLILPCKKSSAAGILGVNHAAQIRAVSQGNMENQSVGPRAWEGPSPPHPR